MTDAELDAAIARAKSIDDTLGKEVGAEADAWLLVAEVRRLSKLLEPDCGHVWRSSNMGLFQICLRCGDAYKGKSSALQPCDPSKLDGKVEFCCDCTAEYPRAELIAGHVYCSRCRVNHPLS